MYTGVDMFAADRMASASGVCRGVLFVVQALMRRFGWHLLVEVCARGARLAKTTGYQSL